MGIVTIYGNRYTFEGLTFRRGTENYHSRFGSARIRNCTFEGNKYYDCNFNDANVFDTSYKEATFDEGTYQYAWFSRCDFSLVNFEGCVFMKSIFVNCNFTRARFTNCVFFDCELRDCQLGYRGNPAFYNGSFIGCKHVSYIPMACPESGPIIGYKKATASNPLGGWTDVIVKLEIPEDAKRSSALGRKCRCNKAKVLGIYAINLFGKLIGVQEDGAVDTVLSYHIGDKMSDETVAFSKFSCMPGTRAGAFPYKVGQWVYPDKWDDDRFNECSHGIHFFMNAQEAADY